MKQVVVAAMLGVSLAAAPVARAEIKADTIRRSPSEPRSVSTKSSVLR